MARNVCGIWRWNASIWVLLALLTLTAVPARASLFTLSASGTISTNTSGDPTIPIGTPWTFKLTYDTAAPDIDPDSDFGTFNNTTAPPALSSFHYRAGSYEVALNHPSDFGLGSVVLISFTSINAIDINVAAPTLFPQLAGKPVSFHADFNRFHSPPIFSSDGLPTNPAINVVSFDQNTVSLLPQSSEVSSSSVASLAISLTGDFNSDGKVGAADYVFWRKNFSGDQAKYNAWRANFGASLTSGGGASLPFAESLSAVPEPRTIALLILAGPGMGLRRGYLAYR